MGSPFVGFAIVVSALDAMQQAVDVAGQNVANASTPGYARERVVLVSQPSLEVAGVAGPTGALGSLGTGVDVAQVQRVTQAYLSQMVRSRQADASYWQQWVQLAQAAQGVLSEPGQNGLTAAMQKMFTDLATLAQTPQSGAARAVAVQDMQNVVSQLNSMAQGLSNLSANLEQDLANRVSQVNGILGQIAQLDQEISAAEMEGLDPNSLLDQRSELLNQLSQQMAIVVGADAAGNFQVTDASTGTVLVDGSTAGSLAVTQDSQGAPVLVSETAAGSSTASPAAISSGGIGADLHLLGGLLAPPGSAAYGSSMQASLDQVAASLAQSMNALQATGYYLDPTTGQAVPASSGGGTSNTPPVPQLFVTANGASSYTAANIQVNPILTQSGGGTYLAAAQTANPGDGSNAQAMADLGQSTLPTSAVQEYSALVSSIGTQVQGAQSQESTSQSLLQQAQTMWQSVSGVSLNEEIASLTQYQQVYTAAAKSMGAMQSMLASLLAVVP